jgi:hypothetical protein
LRFEYRTARCIILLTCRSDVDYPPNRLTLKVM